LEAELSSKLLLFENNSHRSFSSYIFNSFNHASKIIEEISVEAHTLRKFRENLAPINTKLLWVRLYWQTLIQNWDDSAINISLKARKEIAQVFQLGSDPQIS
jgi:hypothetical protein